MSNFTFLGCLEVVDLYMETSKKHKANFFSIYYGFLSLQLKVRLELGLGLRLTKNSGHFVLLQRSAWCNPSIAQLKPGLKAELLLFSFEPVPLNCVFLFQNFCV